MASGILFYLQEQNFKNNNSNFFINVNKCPIVFVNHLASALRFCMNVSQSLSHLDLYQPFQVRYHCIMSLQFMRALVFLRLWLWASISIFCSIVRILDCNSKVLGSSPCMTLGKSLCLFGPHFLHL